MTAIYTTETGPHLSLTVNGPGGLVTIGQTAQRKIRIYVAGRGNATGTEMTMSRAAWAQLRQAAWQLETHEDETLTTTKTETIPSGDTTEQEAEE